MMDVVGGVNHHDCHAASALIGFYDKKGVCVNVMHLVLLFDLIK